MHEAPLKICVIVNPAAGRGQAAARRPLLEKTLAAKAQACGAKWQILETQKAGDATQLAMQAMQNGADLIVAAGGDGTLGEVVNGLAQSGFKGQLGILPCGTGNDFSRCLGIGTDWQKAIEILFEGAPRLVDVGHIRFDETGAEHLFINVAGSGFDACAAQRVNDFRFHHFWRHVHGMPAYLCALLQELVSLRAADLTIEYDGETLQQRALLCAIANATSYGGGMLVAPQAELDDGEFDICLIEEATRSEFLRAFPRVFKGTHTSHPKVKMLRGREVTLKSEPPLPVLVDGDVRGTTPVSFWLEPRVLSVRAPQ